MPIENTMLQLGLLVLSGLLMGRLAERLGMPKVTGYILSGIVLNPGFLPLFSVTFVQDSIPITNFALAFITFEVGGSLSRNELKKHGKTMFLMAFFEAQGAFVMVGLGLLVLAWLMPSLLAASSVALMALLLGSLASPTDPSSTLAVAHEYGSSGPVTNAVMAIAAFDDLFGIVNFSIAFSLAKMLSAGTALDLNSMLLAPGIEVLGGLGVGIGLGLIANFGVARLTLKTDSELLIVVFGMLALSFGLASTLAVDPLLASMVMGATVVNGNVQHERIFKLLERYTESLIFVLFFGLGAMHLDFSVLGSSAVLIAVFALLRALGKIGGAKLGGHLGKAEPVVIRRAPLALIPQGGIVIGLALSIGATPGLQELGRTLVGVVIGATILHEIIGPLLSRYTLRKAGELTPATSSEEGTKRR